MSNPWQDTRVCAFPSISGYLGYPNCIDKNQIRRIKEAGIRRGYEILLYVDISENAGVSYPDGGPNGMLNRDWTLINEFMLELVKAGVDGFTFDENLLFQGAGTVFTPSRMAQFRNDANALIWTQVFNKMNVYPRHPVRMIVAEANVASVETFYLKQGFKPDYLFAEWYIGDGNFQFTLCQDIAARYGIRCGMYVDPSYMDYFQMTLKNSCANSSIVYPAWHYGQVEPTWKDLSNNYFMKVKGGAPLLE